MIHRLQYILPSGLITIVGGCVAWISYTQQPADAFLFPRLISIAFLFLALWTFGKAVLGMSKTGEGVSWSTAKNIFPGLLVSAIYIFWAAKALGFYVALSVAFFILLSLYDPAPHSRVTNWVKRTIITAGVVAVIYGLFAVILKVYTPRGMFI